jgi:hypothetical protein
MALDCVLLKDRNLVLAPRQGPEINSRTCLWVLPRPHHHTQCCLTNQHLILLLMSYLEIAMPYTGFKLTIPKFVQCQATSSSKHVFNWNQHFLTSPQSLVNCGKTHFCSVKRIWRYTGKAGLPGQFGAMVRDGGGSMCGNSSKKARLPSETGCSPFLAHLGHCRDQSPSWHDYLFRTFIWWVMHHTLDQV